MPRLIPDSLLSARPRCGVFGSRSIAGHLLRGLIAAGLIAWAVLNWSEHPAIALASMSAAGVAMRGCPMCWTVGLFETIVGRMKS